MSILASQFTVKGITLNNRIVMPPMATAKSELSGEVSDRLCEYYDEKSAGGYIGLVITEHSYVSPDGKASAGQLSISRDSDIPGLRKLVETIHKNGSKVMAQINHAGGQTQSELTGCPVLGPSAVNYPGRRPTGELPNEMTAADIAHVKESFVRAALRAKEAGFDGVEIHAAHGYLLSQFWSPLSNRRTDEYGGSVENRIRIHTEIIRAVREAVGSDYLVAIRFGASDYMEGGSTIEEAAIAAKELEKAGVDLLDISGGLCGFSPAGKTGAGTFSDSTLAIKAATALPVILAGGVTRGEEAETLLREGCAELIGVARAILKDSSWAKNALAEL